MKLYFYRKLLRHTASPSMRREWIEIRHSTGIGTVCGSSPSMRREWIEIGDKRRSDRCRRESPSMRREWIEMLRHAVPVPASRVSLYAEGVD